MPSASPLNRDVLGFCELEPTLVTALTAQPGLLDTAERRCRVGHDATVHSHHAGLERLADAQRPPQVSGVEVGDETVLGVVGPADRVGLIREAHYRGHRP